MSAPDPNRLPPVARPSHYDLELVPDLDAATFTGGSPGAFQGAYSYLLQDEDGQTIESHSISAGLDYPGVGPEHAYLKDIGRSEYRPITDTEAMDALSLLSRREGIIPAIESAHAVAGALKLGQELGEGALIVVSLSGRGDKDVDTAGRWFNLFEPPPSESDVHAVNNAGKQ